MSKILTNKKSHVAYNTETNEVGWMVEGEFIKFTPPRYYSQHIISCTLKGFKIVEGFGCFLGLVAAICIMVLNGTYTTYGLIGQLSLGISCIVFQFRRCPNFYDIVPIPPKYVFLKGIVMGLLGTLIVGYYAYGAII